MSSRRQVPCPGPQAHPELAPAYLGDEHTRFLDSKGMAGVVGASHDAEPQRAPGSRQADLLEMPSRPKKGFLRTGGPGLAATLGLG